MKSFAAILLIAMCQLATIGSAAAQDPADQRGVELNNRGVEAFGAGRFAEAASYFGQAYDIVGDPAIRKNEAIAWFKAEDCEQAVGAANKFLLLDGTLGGDRAEITTIVANCKVEFANSAIEAGDTNLAEELLIEAEALNPDAHVRDQIKLVRVEIARKNREAKTLAAQAKTADTSTEVSEPLPEPRSQVLEWTLIGSGGAIALAGFVYHAVALGWQTDFLAMASEGGDPETFDSLRKRVHTARIAVPVMYAVGALTAAAGVGLMVAFEPPDASPTSQNPGRVWLGFATEF